MKIYEVKTVYSCVGETDNIKLLSPQASIQYMKNAFDEYPLQEQFWVIACNRKNEAIGRKMITLGTQTSSLVHPREVFHYAIAANACAIICFHNHPSGDPKASQADIQVTRQLKEASKIIGIDLLDHIIIGDNNNYYSFCETGLII